MLKPELLALLNAEAAALRCSHISERMLEDWISEGLIEGPKPKGRRRGANPEWRYASGAAERGLRIVRLRALGAKRFAALRVRLWLSDYDLQTSQISEDLHFEFERLLKRRFYRRPWSYDARTRKFVAKSELKRHAKKLEPVDARLAAAGLKPSDNVILGLGSEFFWGPGGVHNLFNVAKQGISTVVPWLPAEITDRLLADLEPYIQVSGIFGNSDEIEKSGVEELLRAEETDLRDGRKFYQAFLGLFELGANIFSLSGRGGWKEGYDACQAAAASLKEADEWAITFFAMGTLAAYRRRKANPSDKRKQSPPQADRNAPR